MAPKEQESNILKKRKQNPHAKSEPGGSSAKKSKRVSSIPDHDKLNKPFKPLKKQQTKIQSKVDKSEKKLPLNKRERRLHAKELAEVRKKKRKPHYTLEQDLASLWEKIRLRNIAKEERSKLISEAIQKMQGKIPEIASSHVSSRVLQSCIKHCSQTERDIVYAELKPRLLILAVNTYAVHLVMKMLDNASKKQLSEFISTLRGHVASLLRHMVGSVVVEHAYQLGNAAQKQELLLELYSTELQLFKDLATIKESRLLDVISKLKLQKGSVLRHMASVIVPILEKGIVDHSIIHRVIIEYLSIADKSSAAEVIQNLSGPDFPRMIHTRDGCQIGILCVKHGSAKERKKIVKGIKDHVGKIARNQYGSLVLACILSTVDDTKLITKIVIRNLQAILKELIFDKNGRRPLLQLLHPNCSRYCSPDDIALLDSSIPSLSAMGELKINSERSLNDGGISDKTDDITKEVTVADVTENAIPENIHFIDGGKKDPSLRRHELLVSSGLAENLIDVCVENAEEMLRSNFGKEVLYEVATGGASGILHPTLDDKLNNLHEAIASLAAKSKSDEPEKDHVLENFHSSRTIRKLVMDDPTFANTFWTKALKGKCRLWAEGHSSKVIRAFLESEDSKTRELAKKELQPLIDGGILKLPEIMEPANEE